MQEQKNNLYIPGAIILAGFLIAFGIYMSGDRNTTVKTDDATDKININIKPVSKNDSVLGDSNASIVVVEFSDTECPFCKRFHTTMHNIMDIYSKDGKVAWVYRHFPLDSLHKKTRKEAESVECAGSLGGDNAYWKMLDSIYTNTTSNDGLDATKLPVFAKDAGLDVAKFNECVSSGKMASVVEAEYQDGVKAGIQGTPYSILILKSSLKKTAESEIKEYITVNNLSNNIKISSDKKEVALNGALPVEMVTKIIDIILK